MDIGQGRWGVYALALEKLGYRALVYIGSATDTRDDVWARWRHYDRPEAYITMVPKYVQASLNDGYEIVSKGMLIWTPILSAADSPRLRLLFLTLEATLSVEIYSCKSITAKQSIHRLDLFNWYNMDPSFSSSDIESDGEPKLNPQSHRGAASIKIIRNGFDAETYRQQENSKEPFPSTRFHFWIINCPA